MSKSTGTNHICDWCFLLYSREVHFSESGQHYGGMGETHGQPQISDRSTYNWQAWAQLLVLGHYAVLNNQCNQMCANIYKRYIHIPST